MSKGSTLSTAGACGPGRGSTDIRPVCPEPIDVREGWDSSEGTRSFPRVQVQSITSAPNPQARQGHGWFTKQTPARLSGQSTWPFPPALPAAPVPPPRSRRK